MKYKLLTLFLVLVLVTGCNKKSNTNVLEEFEKKMQADNYKYIILEDYSLAKNAKSGKKYVFSDEAPVSVYYFDKSSKEYKAMLKEGCISVKGTNVSKDYAKECEIEFNNGYVLFIDGVHSKDIELKEMFNSIK